MPTNGMTIDSLNTVSSLTAQDEVPVWDKEASGEHTRKITAQNLTNSVKTLGSLVNTTEMNTAIANMATSLMKAAIAAGTSCTIAFSSAGRRSAIISVVSSSGGRYATYIYEGYGVGSGRQAVTPLTPGNTYYTVTMENDAQGITITPGEQVTGTYDVGVLTVFGNPPTIT